MSKASKILCWAGTVLLLVMAVFHGSGYAFVREAILESDARDFLKEIVPVLFVHPSIHLLGLAALGGLAVFIESGAEKLLFLLSLIVLADAMLAFYLGGILPGVLLLAAAGSYAIAGRRQ